MNHQPTPILVHKVSFGDTGLYESIVDYTDEDKEMFPFQLQSNFITKELRIEDLSSFIVQVNPVLNEIFFNKTLKSQYLNTAKYITIQNSNVVLFYDKADGDFYKIRRVDKSLLKQWINSIVKGTLELHRKRILHGDIKASNVLIFNGVAKLNDFGMSVLMTGNSIESIRSKLYTLTHRPPELFNGNTCDLSADIWALGCTIYEIVYGEPLFRVMKNIDEYTSQMNIWCNNFSFSNHSSMFNQNWNNPENIEINNLILKMLNPDPLSRPSIFEIANDNYFLSYSGFSSLQSSAFNSPFSGSPSVSFLMSNSFSSNVSFSSRSSEEFLPIILKRTYNKSHFESDERLVEIYNKLKTKENNKEIRMLVMCMLNSFNREIRYDNSLVHVLHIIAHILTNRHTPYYLTVTRKVINDLLNYSNMVNFNYLNWNRYYGF